MAVIVSRNPNGGGPPALAAPMDLAEASFLGLWIETLLYGVFLVLFTGTLWAIFVKRNTERVNRVMLITACLLLALATTHLAINLTRVIEAFIGNPENPTAYLANVSNKLHMAKLGVYGAEALIADALLLYRIYIVWGRSWWVTVPPAVMVVASGVAGYGGLYIFGFVGTGSAFASQLTLWITTFFCLTLATNIICTCLLAYRIWSIQKQVGAGYGQSKPIDVIPIIVESGMIYSGALILQIIFYVLRSNVQYIILEPFASLVGIVFCMIIIRVSLGIAKNGSNKSGSMNTHSMKTFTHHTHHTYPHIPAHHTTSGGVGADTVNGHPAGGPLTVTVKRVVDQSSTHSDPTLSPRGKGTGSDVDSLDEDAVRYSRHSGH